jgi:hypothetical protein
LAAIPASDAPSAWDDVASEDPEVFDSSRTPEVPPVAGAPPVLAGPPAPPVCAGLVGGTSGAPSGPGTDGAPPLVSAGGEPGGSPGLPSGISAGVPAAGSLWLSVTVSSSTHGPLPWRRGVDHRAACTKRTKSVGIVRLAAP